MFQRVSRAVKNILKVRGLWKRVALNGLYNWAGPDWPPIVEGQENKWVIREGMHRIRGMTRYLLVPVEILRQKILYLLKSQRD